MRRALAPLLALTVAASLSALAGTGAAAAPVTSEPEAATTTTEPSGSTTSVAATTTEAAPVTTATVADPTTTTTEPEPTTVTADRDQRRLDRDIQILAVDEERDGPGGEIVLEVAVPPSFALAGALDSNFAVTDGGRLVDVTVAPLEIPSETVLVLDVSGSMRGSALDAARAAARSFVTNLPDDTRIGLVTFGETVTVVREPGLDREAILTDLDQLEATDDETVLWDALVASAGLVGDSDAGRSSVVVLSDGDDTVSVADRADAVARLRASSILLYAVAIESPDTDLLALEQTVDLVGGHFLATGDVAELDSLYTDIAGRLANRYRIRFTPAAEGPRTVVVSVAAGGEVATAHTTVRGVGGGPPVRPQGSPPPGVTEPGGGGPAPVLNLDGEAVLGPVAVAAPGPLTGKPLLWAGLVSMFAALAIVGFSLVRPSTQVRLGAAAGADRLAGVNARLGHAADQLIARHDHQRRLDARLDAADVDLRPGEFIVVWALLIGAGALTVLTLFGPVAGVLSVPLAAAGVVLGLRVRAGRRRAKFAEQLTETLGIMASSLRAGLSLPRTIELVANEAPAPTAAEFHRINFEIRVGRDLTHSIRQAAQRMASPDLEWLAQAVDINRELGGDLTEILDNVATTIRERRTVSRQIEALSAEGRATGWLLLAMPVAMFGFSWWRTPDAIGTMFREPVGRLLLVLAVGGMVIGHLWIRRLVKLRF